MIFSDNQAILKALAKNSRDSKECTEKAEDASTILPRKEKLNLTGSLDSLEDNDNAGEHASEGSSTSLADPNVEVELRFIVDARLKSVYDILEMRLDNQEVYKYIYNRKLSNFHP